MLPSTTCVKADSQHTPNTPEPRPPSTKLNGSFGWEGSGSTRISSTLSSVNKHSGLRMHAAKPASLQTAQPQAYRVFARCPRSLAGPSRRGGGSHCVPFMVDLKPPNSSITSEVRTLRTRVDMQMPSHPLPYLPAAGRCAIRHPPSATPTAQQPQHPCRPCAQSPTSSARLVSSLLFSCFPFATRPARHCSDAPWCGAAAEETARLVLPMAFLRKDAAIAVYARPCPTLPDHPAYRAARRHQAGARGLPQPQPLRYVLPLPCEFINTALVTPLRTLQSTSVTNSIISYSCTVSDTMAFGGS